MQSVRCFFRSSFSPSSMSRASSPLPRCSDGARGPVPGFVAAGGMPFSHSAAAPACSPSSYLEKEQVTTRIVDLLKSIPFIDPAKVSPTAHLKDDLDLNMLDNVEVLISVEEEFAVDISDNENNISTVAHLIDYIATHPQAK